mmetsp:Transcript_15330/g.51573  ORF Transcript_15330/g.51573 Transcript_15330/m.51573 type:complete len:246 (+) Transcript_15330:598-1335(+)
MRRLGGGARPFRVKGLDVRRRRRGEVARQEHRRQFFRGHKRRQRRPDRVVEVKGDALACAVGPVGRRARRARVPERADDVGDLRARRGDVDERRVDDKVGAPHAVGVVELAREDRVELLGRHARPLQRAAPLLVGRVARHCEHVIKVVVVAERLEEERHVDGGEPGAAGGLAGEPVCAVGGDERVHNSLEAEEGGVDVARIRQRRHEPRAVDAAASVGEDGGAERRRNGRHRRAQIGVEPVHRRV